MFKIKHDNCLINVELQQGTINTKFDVILTLHRR